VRLREFKLLGQEKCYTFYQSPPSVPPGFAKMSRWFHSSLTVYPWPALYLTLDQLMWWWVLLELCWSHRLIWLLLGSSWSLSNSDSHFKMAKDLFRLSPESLVQVSLKIWNMTCWGIWSVMWLSHRPEMCLLFIRMIWITFSCLTSWKIPKYNWTDNSEELLFTFHRH